MSHNPVTTSLHSHHDEVPPLKTLQFNQYNTGLFDCTEDIPSCVDACLCSSCHLARVCHMLNHHKRDTNCLMTTGIILGDIGSLDCSASFATTLAVRTMSNIFLGIDESWTACCLKSCFCNSCSRCQVHRELSLRNMWPGGLFADEPYRKKGYLLPPRPSMMGYNGGNEATRTMRRSAVATRDHRDNFFSVVSAPTLPQMTATTTNRLPTAAIVDQHRDHDDVRPPTPPARAAGGDGSGGGGDVNLYPIVVATLLEGAYDVYGSHYSTTAPPGGGRGGGAWDLQLDGRSGSVDAAAFADVQDEVAVAGRLNRAYYYVGAQPAPPPASEQSLQQQQRQHPIPVYGYVGQPPTYGRPLKTL